MKSLLNLVTAASVLMVPALSHATPITFIFSATGANLSLNDVIKNDIDFTVSFVADTNNVNYFSGNSPRYASLTGAMTLSDGTKLSFENANVFNNRAVGVVGFGVVGMANIYGAIDLFDLEAASLLNYDGLSGFGPISSNNISAINQWRNLSTSAGNLTLLSVESGSFSSQFDSAQVPEPSSLALLALGIAATGLSQRMRARR